MDSLLKVRRYRLVIVAAIVGIIMVVLFSQGHSAPTASIERSKHPQDRVFNGLINEDGNLLKDAVQELSEKEKDEKEMNKQLNAQLDIIKKKMYDKKKKYKANN